MNRLIILKSWEKHKDAAIPSYAFPAYFRDHRLSFYAGAGAVISAVIGALNPNEKGEIDSKIVQDLADELKAFIKEMEESIPKAKASFFN